MEFDDKIPAGKGLVVCLRDMEMVPVGYSLMTWSQTKRPTRSIGPTATAIRLRQS